MNEETISYKNSTLEEAKVFFPDIYDSIEQEINNITNEDKLLEKLDKIKSQINIRKNASNTTYYGNITEDEKIYDSNKDKTIIKEALKKAPNEFKDKNPESLLESKQYSSLKRYTVVYSKELGYTAKEDENGIFYGLMKADRIYLYPNKDMELSDENINILSLLYGRTDRIELTKENIDLSGIIYPAYIDMPITPNMSDPINKLTYGEVLIANGITVDKNFKNTPVKEINKTIKKGYITKGYIKSKEVKKIIDKDVDKTGYKDEFIVEPTKYIDGTFIKSPRKKQDNETDEEYNKYLTEYYKTYGLEENVEFTKVGEDETILPEQEQIKEDKYGLKEFLKTKYKIDSLKGIDRILKISYLKAYKEYLNELITKYPSIKDTINEKLKNAEEIIEKLESKKMF